MLKLLVGVTGLALAASAQAQTWIEVPDAPELTAQATVGIGALTSIIGNTADPVGDTGVDMYCVLVRDWTTFSASLVGGATWDTQLFLFDSFGNGIACNDDSVGFQSALPSPNPWYSGRTSPELVMIAVSGYNRDPSSAGGLIFPNTFTGVLGPLGPGGGSPLSSWGGSSASGAYTLALTGVEYCIPTPGSLALLGLGGLAAIRRRRA